MPVGKKLQSYPWVGSCHLRILVLFPMSLQSEKSGFPVWFSVSSVRPGRELFTRLFQTERARFLYSSDQLLVEHGEGGVRWEVQTIKASVSPAETETYIKR